MPAARRITVLAVDDNEIHRYALARTLQARGFTVLQANCGYQALSLAQQHPDVILLDVHLPDVSGDEVAKQLRTNAATAAIPVIFLSATEPMGFGQEAVSTLGAKGFLTYPVEPQDLEIVIAGTLARRQRKPPDCPNEGTPAAS